MTTPATSSNNTQKVSRDQNNGTANANRNFRPERPVNAEACACRLFPGEKMAVFSNFVPTGGDARPGVDFDFVPWYQGRAATGLPAVTGYQPDRMAILVAKTELILSVAAPSTWQNEHPVACSEVYHIRRGIAGCDDYGIAGKENLYLCSWSRTALRRSEAPEHRVRGGLTNMVIYPQLEVVIPNYFFNPETPVGDQFVQMHGFILRKEAVAEHRERGRQLTPRRDKETGAKRTVAIKLPCPTGVLRTVDPTPALRLVLDEMGVIFKIIFNGENQNEVTLGGGSIRLTVGVVPTDNQVRARLGLPLLETEVSIMDTVCSAGPTPQRHVGKSNVGEAIKHAVVTRATVEVPRRTKAPKLTPAPAAEVQTSIEEQSVKEEIPEPVAEVQTSLEEPAAEVQTSLEEPAAEVQTSLEEPAAEVAVQTAAVLCAPHDGPISRKEVLATMAGFIADDTPLPAVVEVATGMILFAGGEPTYENTEEFIQWLRTEGTAAVEPLKA